MTDPTFEFQVAHIEADDGHHPEGWAVTLPHQCGPWSIAGERYSPESREDCIQELERFIGEAQDALTALIEGRELNREVEESWD